MLRLNLNRRGSTRFLSVISSKLGGSKATNNPVVSKHALSKSMRLARSQWSHRWLALPDNNTCHYSCNDLVFFISIVQGTRILWGDRSHSIGKLVCYQNWHLWAAFPLKLNIFSYFRPHTLYVQSNKSSVQAKVPVLTQRCSPNHPQQSKDFPRTSNKPPHQDQHNKDPNHSQDRAPPAQPTSIAQTHIFLNKLGRADKARVNGRMNHVAENEEENDCCKDMKTSVHGRKKADAERRGSEERGMRE